MARTNPLFAATAAFCLALTGLPHTAGAEGAGIMVEDAYARTASSMSKSGAAFMVLHNHGTEPDRLVSAQSDIAVRVELHTHKDLGDGVMQMIEVEEGFPIPAGGTYVLERGGDHVMFMGLTGPMEQDQEIEVTLRFEQAGDLVVTIPVDNERMPAHDHSGHGHDHSHGSHGSDSMQTN